MTRARATTTIAAVACAACGLSVAGELGSGNQGPDASVSAEGGSGNDSAATGDGSNISVEKEWAKKRELTLDNFGNGALVDFPILVRLDATRINYTIMQPSGADLRFTDEQSNVLVHEIERWNPSGSSIVWVKVPAIAAQTKSRIWMYYGNPKATDTQNAVGVWSAGFAGVWHLADDRDSTGNHASINVGGVAADGFVGRGLSFNGTNQYFDTKANENLADFTIEVVMRAATAAASGVPASGPLSKGLQYQFQWNCSSVSFCQAAVCQPKATAAIAKLGNLVASQWYYLVGTYDGTTLTSYVDGVEANATVGSGGPSSVESGTTKLGARVSINSGEFFNGLVDEARISKVSRSADWVRAQNRSLRNTFVSFGPEL